MFAFGLNYDESLSLHGLAGWHLPFSPEAKEEEQFNSPDPQ
jgi:hypothetical protein